MVIISPQLGMSPTATTGGETYDREVLGQFIKLGQDVRILLPKEKDIPSGVSGWKVDRTPVGHFAPPYTFNIFAFPWVVRQLKQETPDVRQESPELVLRIHSPEYLFSTGYLVKKFFPKIPVIAHYHLDQTGRLWTAMNRKLLSTVDAVIADSQYLKKQLVNRVGIAAEKIHVIHCGVDIDTIKPKVYKGPTLPRQGRTLSDIKIILFLGRFIERKRPDLAIEIFAKLHAKHPDTKLIMVGEGPMEEKLKAQSSKLKVSEAIEFAGPLFGKEKLERYHEADLFLFPSEKEGFVLVVLEAMAAGLPLLVPRALGFGEAVEDGENGFLAVSSDINDWVTKAEKILFDEKINQAMRKRSRELAVRKFSWEECAKKNLEVYHQFHRYEFRAH